MTHMSCSLFSEYTCSVSSNACFALVKFGLPRRCFSLLTQHYSFFFYFQVYRPLRELLSLDVRLTVTEVLGSLTVPSILRLNFHTLLPHLKLLEHDSNSTKIGCFV
jgi:hypothetical protein